MTSFQLNLNYIEQIQRNTVHLLEAIENVNESDQVYLSRLLRLFKDEYCKLVKDCIEKIEYITNE